MRILQSHKNTINGGEICENSGIAGGGCVLHLRHWQFTCSNCEWLEKCMLESIMG